MAPIGLDPGEEEEDSLEEDQDMGEIPCCRQEKGASLSPLCMQPLQYQ